MGICINCHQPVKSGGDRHAKGACPAKAKDKEKAERTAQAGDLATEGRGKEVALAGKSSQDKSRKGKSRGSKSS